MNKTVEVEANNIIVAQRAATTTIMKGSYSESLALHSPEPLTTIAVYLFAVLCPVQKLSPGIVRDGTSELDVERVLHVQSGVHR